MVQKAKFRQRHLDAFLAGNKKDIPADVLEVLEKQEAEKSKGAKPKSTETEKEAK